MHILLFIIGYFLLYPLFYDIFLLLSKYLSIIRFDMYFYNGHYVVSKGCIPFLYNDFYMLHFQHTVKGNVIPICIRKMNKKRTSLLEPTSKAKVKR